ncbi:MAG: hypothetical protein HY055_04505 [Magnetospirillum sp.]|nr:hypothetical protein [Magnetospirillum sp.]
MPDKIRNFLLLIYVSLGFGVTVSALQFAHLANGGNAQFIIIVQATVMVALAVMTHLIAHGGWNWARWVCTISWCVGLPFLMLALTMALQVSPLSGGLLGAELLAQAGGIALLFSEDASDWFGA